MLQTPTPITISISTIIKISLVIFAIWALYLISDIILLLAASLLLAAAIDPFVDKLQRRGIPRSISMIGIFLVVFIVVSITLYLIIPPLIDQVAALAANFPGIYNQLMDWTSQLSPDGNSAYQAASLPNALTTATRGVFSFVSNIFGGIFSFLTVIVMTFYIVIDEGSITRTLAIAPKRYQPYLSNLYERLQSQLGLWLRAQLTLMILVGVLTYVLLSLISLFGYHMPYILTLSLIAGLTEFIPYVGPIIGAIPAIFLAYNISPMFMVVIALTYYGIQTLENNVLVPKIMERALGLSPIISILVFLVGANLAGIMGAILAIPIATACAEIIKDIMAKKNIAEAA